MSPTTDVDDAVPVSERVTDAIATKLEKEPRELEPLYHSVAPGCLDELFPVSSDTPGEPVRQFTFTYEEHVVNVSHDGSVEISPKGGASPDLPQTGATSATGPRNPETPD